MNNAISQYEMAVYRKMMVGMGQWAGQLSMRALDGKTIPHAWLKSLIRAAVEVQFVGYAPDWPGPIQPGLHPVAEPVWTAFLAENIIKRERNYILPIEACLGNEFKSYWAKPWVLTRDAGGKFIQTLPGVPLVAADITKIDYAPFCKTLPNVLPLGGNAFGKATARHGKKALKMAHPGGNVVNFVPWGQHILFMADESTLEKFLTLLIPDVVFEENTESFLIRHWGKCIRHSKGEDVAAHAKNAIDLLDTLPMEGA